MNLSVEHKRFLNELKKASEKAMQAMNDEFISKENRKLLMHLWQESLENYNSFFLTIIRANTNPDLDSMHNSN